VRSQGKTLPVHSCPSLIMERHPDRETLERFVCRTLAPAKARLTERHLVICSTCRKVADEASTSAQLRLLEAWFQPAYEPALERAVHRAAETLRGLLEEGWSAEGLVAELLREPIPERRRRIRHEARFQTLKLCQLLLARSRNAWFDDPADALEMADLAVETARQLDAAKYGSSLVEDARALAWGHLGNAFRIVSDFWRAEQALRQAWIHHLLAGADAYTEAKLLNFTASLRYSQGRLDEAIQLVDRALAIYREGEDHHLEGSSLIQKALFLEDRGRYAEALSLTRAGLARIDPVKEPKLLLAGQHNLIGLLNRGGAPDKAQRLLDRSRSLYYDIGDRLVLFRLRWIEGLLALTLGRLSAAETALSEVRDTVLDRGLGREVTVVSLDLAGLYAQQGRRFEVKELTGELVSLAEALGLRREALLARLLFARASRA
jgi:tetratricopeptide (TPR) repeat protein